MLTANHKNMAVEAHEHGLSDVRFLKLKEKLKDLS